MKTLPLAVAAATAIAALTACGSSPTYVLQQCTATYPDGSVQVVPDDYCVDHANWYYGGVYYPPVWYYGGSTYRTGNRWYVRGGATHRPVNVLTTVRDPRYGGSARAQGAARSYNEAVRKTLGIAPTYQAKPGYGGSVKSGDDRRQPKSGSTGTFRSSTTRK